MSRWPLLGEGDRGGGGVGLLLETKLRGFSPSPEMIVRPRLSARLIGSDAVARPLRRAAGVREDDPPRAVARARRAPVRLVHSRFRRQRPGRALDRDRRGDPPRPPGFRRRRRGRAPGPPRRRARRADPRRRPGARVASGRARPRPRRLPGGRQLGLPRLARLLHGGEAEERPARHREPRRSADPGREAPRRRAPARAARARPLLHEGRGGGLPQRAAGPRARPREPRGPARTYRGLARRGLPRVALPASEHRSGRVRIRLRRLEPPRRRLPDRGRSRLAGRAASGTSCSRPRSSTRSRLRSATR